VNALKNRLVPLSLLVTPNISETKVLAAMEILSLDDMIEAGRIICGMGAKNVLIKGGHLQGEAVDVLFDGEKDTKYSAPRIVTKNTHGTGCTLSSAIAAEIAKGSPLPEAVKSAKEYVTRAIKSSLEIGIGHGPLNHWA
jgi:hydroxymethylpyrimidine kinase/phosphomethylpyrimidine kinase